MNKLIIYCIAILTFISCSNPESKFDENICQIKLDSLILNIDTSQVEFRTFHESDSIEIIDKAVLKEGEGSVFHFSSSGILGLYAFMTDWPKTNFIVTYDSTGIKKRLQENEVVQWSYLTLKPDSILSVTVLLCAVDRNYEDLILSAGSFYDSAIQIFKSKYTKLVCFKSDVPIKGLKSNFIYLKGIRQEKCSGLINEFKDSMNVQNLENSAQHSAWRYGWLKNHFSTVGNLLGGSSGWNSKLN